MDGHPPGARLKPVARFPISYTENRATFETCQGSRQPLRSGEGLWCLLGSVPRYSGRKFAIKDFLFQANFVP